MKFKIGGFPRYTSNDETFFSRLLRIYDEIKDEGRIDIFGVLTFELSDKIGGDSQKIAVIKGDKITVKRSASALPDVALKYVIAHELAHIHIKKHTRKFWKILENIYPGFKEAQDLIIKYKSSIA